MRKGKKIIYWPRWLCPFWFWSADQNYWSWLMDKNHHGWALDRRPSACIIVMPKFFWLKEEFLSNRLLYWWGDLKGHFADFSVQDLGYPVTPVIRIFRLGSFLSFDDATLKWEEGGGHNGCGYDQSLSWVYKRDTSKPHHQEEDFFQMRWLGVF